VSENYSTATVSLLDDEPGLPPDAFIGSIWQERRRYVREGRIKQPHPWSIALGRGQVSVEGLRGYLKNRYYFLVNINRKDAQIIANCPIPDARRLLMRKYIDEEGRDIVGGGLGPHYEMWLKVSDALGISRELMNSFRDVLPLYRFAVDAIFHFAKQSTWLEGLAATYATEGGMWKRYTPKDEHGPRDFLDEGEALKAYYGLVDQDLEFFFVHGDANDEHGNICEAILKEYCTSREQQRKAVAAARFRWEQHEARHDVIYQYFAAA
jgi:pyrroloquinoline-quinone synthase